MKQKIISGVLAAAISIGLWLYVVTVVNPEWEQEFYNIPVQLENMEALNANDRILYSDQQYTVNLKLSGNRSEMIKLNSGNIKISVDLSRIYAPGDQNVEYSISYPEGVPSNAFEVVHKTQVILPIVQRHSKNVNVTFVNAEGEPAKAPDGYEAALEGQTLKITGPADEVNRVESAKIIVDLSNQKTDLTQKFDYVLLDAKGNPVESKWITVVSSELTIPVQRVEYVKLAVNVTGGTDWEIKEIKKVAFFDKATNDITEQSVKLVGAGIDELISNGIIKDGKLYFETIDFTKEIIKKDENGVFYIDKRDIKLSEWLKGYNVTTDADKNAVGVIVKAEIEKKAT